jgi:deazaflavin-dependent oxidoreductase (nitroreductase family)
MADRAMAARMAAVISGGVMPAAETHPRTRPLLGLRQQPGRLARAVFRLPLPLYRRGWGSLLGHTFLLVTHVGRKTGRCRETVAMALTYDPETRETVVCSAWGPGTDWIRNIRARPALRIQIGRETYVPEQRFLSEDESVATAADFRRRHPWRLRLLAGILGWGDLGSEESLREFVHGRPFVSFRPATPALPWSRRERLAGGTERRQREVDRRRGEASVR